MNNNLIKSILIVSFFVFSPLLKSQDSEQPFMITYIEITPGYEDQVTALLSQASYYAREHAGNLRYQAFQRLGRPNHFAIFETWVDQNSMTDHRSQIDFINYRETIESVTYSPYDERPSTAIFNTANQGQEGDVYTITHIDIIPTAVEEGRVLISDLVSETRKESGATDIAIMEQNNRRNHFTLIETWTSAQDFQNHVSQEYAVNFRNELLSRSGSLYDERLYKLID
jgi:quinol monooxygenase YgiN